MSEEKFRRLLGKAIGKPLSVPKLGSKAQEKGAGYSGKRTRPHKPASASQKRSGKSRG